jgi:hypothetical protein
MYNCSFKTSKKQCVPLPPELLSELENNFKASPCYKYVGGKRIFGNTADENYIDKYFEIKPTDDGRGLGVFSKFCLPLLPSKSALTCYRGEILDGVNDADLTRQQAAYVMSLSVDLDDSDNPTIIMIDADRHHISSRCNHSNPDNANTAMSSCGQMYMLKPICSGEELTWDYGFEYWSYQVMGIDFYELSYSQQDTWTNIFRNTSNFNYLLKDNIYLKPRAERFRRVVELFDKMCKL